MIWTWNEVVCDMRAWSEVVWNVHGIKWYVVIDIWSYILSAKWSCTNDHETKHEMITKLRITLLLNVGVKKNH